MKKLNLNEEFALEGFVYTFTLKEGGISLKRVRGIKSKPSFIPPTKLEVMAFFLSKGYLETAAIKAFEYYDVSNWKDGRGNQVLNWKQKMMANWFTDQNKIIKQETKGIAFFQNGK